MASGLSVFEMDWWRGQHFDDGGVPYFPIALSCIVLVRAAMSAAAAVAAHLPGNMAGLAWPMS
jgi:hypothetical protein